MKIVNVIIVFDDEQQHVLMCHRQKDPYKGLYNFVGGKKEANESDLEAAYRELHEESGITQADITLTKLMTSQYHNDNIELQVYYGTLRQMINLKEEINPLVWMSIAEDFSDTNKFAGHGNIKHMMAMISEGQKHL